jgi:hypothetical protein
VRFGDVADQGIILPDWHICEDKLGLDSALSDLEDTSDTERIIVQRFSIGF